MIFASEAALAPWGAHGDPRGIQGTPQGGPKDTPGCPRDPWGTSPGPQGPQGTGNIYTKTPDQPQDAADMLYTPP